jgi:NADPH2:quinone reductase
MRAVIYANAGDTSVLQVVERPLEEPAEGEVRIRVAVSGVNPTDWKSRSGASGARRASRPFPTTTAPGSSTPSGRASPASGPATACG